MFSIAKIFIPINTLSLAFSYREQVSEVFNQEDIEIEDKSLNE